MECNATKHLFNVKRKLKLKNYGKSMQVCRQIIASIEAFNVKRDVNHQHLSENIKKKKLYISVIKL